jgi:hypothetical protein
LGDFDGESGHLDLESWVVVEGGGFDVMQFFRFVLEIQTGSIFKNLRDTMNAVVLYSWI